MQAPYLNAIVWRWGCVTLALLLSACGGMPLERPKQVNPSNVNADAQLTPVTRITRDLVKLPPPKFKVPVAVYAFRDQTGQFKPQPDSNLSNAVTQGAASILVKSLLDSGWYLPIEREGFQNLLNERRVARAIEVPADNGRVGSSYPVLIPAQFLFEGGIVGYESNVRTGGYGANVLGIGSDAKYRIDQVTVNLRSVDVRTGQVANSVSVTKTIFSQQVSASVYQFVTYKTLLQAEGGYTSNEPSQLAVKEAIETAVIHLTLQGISGRVWALKNEQDWYLPMVQSYLRDVDLQLSDPEIKAEASTEPAAIREPVLIRPPQLPLHLMALPSPSEVAAAAPSSATNPANATNATNATNGKPASAPVPATTPAPAPVAAAQVKATPTAVPVPVQVAAPTPTPVAIAQVKAPTTPLPVSVPVPTPAPLALAQAKATPIAPPAPVSLPVPVPTPAPLAVAEVKATPTAVPVPLPEPVSAPTPKPVPIVVQTPALVLPAAQKAPASKTLPEEVFSVEILPAVSI